MSFQVEKFSFANKRIILSDQKEYNNDHIFTILTGRNGVGKSRLLVSLVSRFLSSNTLFEGLHSNIRPNKVIAVSNIKNDKFPLKKKNSEKYHYIGSKPNHFMQLNERFAVFKNLLINKKIDRNNTEQAINYLGFDSKFFINLSPIKNTYNKPLDQLQSYSKVYKDNYNYFINSISTLRLKTKLENILIEISHYEQKINDNNILDFTEPLVNYDYNIHTRTTIKKRVLNNKNISDEIFRNIVKSFDKYEIFFLDCLVKLDESKILVNYDFIQRLSSIIIDNTISKLISNSIEINLDIDYFDEFLQDLNFLLENNFLRITNVKLIDRISLREIDFFDLSSGQQSLFNILLGISSVIEDNCLICIDEPEVNLHPEWQNEFIIKLQYIFNHINGCHFIIATHSPQIVAGLTSQNGYIVDLENNITHTADDYSKKSSDYQLAHLFNFPGYNNEYLIRIALTLLSKLTKDLELNSNDIANLNTLNNLKNDLPSNDPVNFLIEQINALV